MKVSDFKFRVSKHSESDILYTFEIDGIGRITVLDRETGWGQGVRDIETGFKDINNKFWLASGMFDIRDYPELTLQEAIEKIKEFANTCIGE